MIRLILSAVASTLLAGCYSGVDHSTGEPRVAEQHHAVINVDQMPKELMRQPLATLYDVDSVVWAVNVGGGEHTGIDGVRYRADEMISGGERGQLDTVRGAQDDAIYQSYRSGDMEVRRPLANGSYDISFHFTEPEDIPVGARVFDVLAQGRKVIDQLDVRQARGGNHISALKRTVTDVVVHDGQLEIKFVTRVGTPILSAIEVRDRKPDPRQWEPAWADEFDYEGAPDPRKWNAHVWEARWVNNEDQAYTDRSDNVRVAGGRLILEAHREDYGDARYTSARIDSRGKGDFKYGRVDIRARLPGGRGTWSALWMLPADPFRYATNCNPDQEWNGRSDCDAWPNSGEIDIMEHVGYDMQRVHGTVHNRAYYTANLEQRNGGIEVQDVERAFHVYSLEWTPQYIRVFLDGSLYFSYLNQGMGWPAWPFDQPHHIILNLAIGGWWGRAGGPIDDSIFPTRMEVDYVRVFRESNSGLSNLPK